MTQETQETVKDSLEQKDYSEPELKEDYVKNTVSLIDGKLRVNVEPYGDIFILKTNYNIHAAVQIYAAALRFKIMKENPDLPTEKQLRTLLSERGIWTEEDDSKIETVDARRAELEEDYKDMISPIKGKNAAKTKRAKKLAQGIADVRNEQTELYGTRQAYLGASIEGVTESLSKLFMLYSCLQKEDGALMWPTFDKMMEVIDDDTMVTLLAHATLHWAGLRDDFLDSAPGKEPGESDG